MRIFDLPRLVSTARRPAALVLNSMLTLLLAATLNGCASLTKPWIAPEVSVTSLKPQQIKLDQQTLLVGLRIRNPNDRMLPIDAMSYRLSLEGDEIAAGGGKLERQIPAFGEADAVVSVTGNTAGLVGRLPWLMLQSRPLQYKIAGTVTVAGILPIPYRYSGEFDQKMLLRAALPR